MRFSRSGLAERTIRSNYKSGVDGVKRTALPHCNMGGARLIRHHAPDALAVMHEIERIVDLGERHGVRDQTVDVDLALHVPVDDLGYVGASARAAEGRAFPNAPRYELEGPRGDFL